MSNQHAAEPIRVVVAGVGAITALGPSADALWQGASAGRVAIRPVQRLPMDGYRTRLGGEVDEFDPPTHTYRFPPGHRERVIDFALKAAEEAVDASLLPPGTVAPERWGVVMGTCNAGLLSFETWYAGRVSGQRQPAELLQLTTPQALAEAVSGAFDCKGPVLSINTACAAGANAVGYAADLIRLGHADAMLAGGSDAFSDVLFAGFNSLESLSPAPAAPYSRDRLGLSLGEGSGMLVLIREDLARQAGLPIIGEVLGYGLSADGYHPTAPHPEGRGASRAIRAALESAGVAADEVGYVNSHGTGTAKNDPAETRATRRGLGAAADHVAVSSTKSMIGHLLGAAGAVEAIVTLKALQDQLAPPTANYTEADPECDLDYVPNLARPLAMDVAISNNFAFGGANATVVFQRADAPARPSPQTSLARVVVTGLATLTAAGSQTNQVYDAFTSGRTCTRVEDGVLIGRVDFDLSSMLSARERRRMDRLGMFSVAASRFALQDAGIEVTDANRERLGVIFGTGIGPMESMVDFLHPLLDEGPQAANPALFPNTVYNAAPGQVAMLVGTVGPTSTVTTGHAAGGAAICYGYDLLTRRQADALVCLAADALTDTVIAWYRDLEFFLPEGGPALAEAAVGLVLEDLGIAQQRNARIYGEVLGYGITQDGLGIGAIDPQGIGLERAMRLAIDNAGLNPNDIVGVWASEFGAPVSGAAERAALQRVIGESVLVYSPKRLFGEPIGAGGALNASLALKKFESDEGSRGPVLINSCSLGGTNVALVLAPYNAE